MLPNNWAMQVLDPERQRTFEAILAQPDDGLRRAHKVTQPAIREGCAVWLDLSRKYVAWFWAERRQDDSAGRAHRKPKVQYWFPYGDRLV